MKIGIDARCLIEDKKTGVHEYTVGALRKVLKEDQENEYKLFINSYKKPETDFSWLEKYPNVEIKNYGFPNKFFNLLIWIFGWPKIDILLGGVDVFFAPNISFLALSEKCQLTLTVHDLSFERFPEHFSFKRRLWHFVINPRRLCRRANKILAVSESTRDDLISLYGITKKKIEVVAPTFALERFSQKKMTQIDRIRVKTRYDLPNRFVLFLGTIEPRKNILSVIRAFEQMKRDEPETHNLHLVIAGQLGWSYKEIILAAHESEFSDEILTVGYVKEKYKPAIFDLAEFFVYPSFFEGFGFPVVESMSMGTPVITSNCSSLPEVAKDAAILIDPYRPSEITDAMKLFLLNKETRETYSKRGLQRTTALLKVSQERKMSETILNYK